MSAYQTLLDYIEEYIHQNSNKEITGNILQTVIKEVVNQVGQAQFLGVAITTDTPYATEKPSFYLASCGYYTNFGNGLRITTPIGILYFNGSTWNVKELGVYTLTSKSSTTSPLAENTIPSSLINGITGNYKDTLRFDYMNISNPSGSYLVISMLASNLSGYQIACRLDSSALLVRVASGDAWGSWGSFGNVENKVSETVSNSNSPVIFVMPAGSRITNITVQKVTGTPDVACYYLFNSERRYLSQIESFDTNIVSSPCSDVFELDTDLVIEVAGTGSVKVVVEYKLNVL